MSLMAMPAPRSSMFTFESKAHSSHVLLRLDEQRRRDTLCDVTVVAEGQSFRAHRAVLASCSEYFAHRISSPTHQGEVITLPQEVTAAGFEPLLNFAYTSKLLFCKENVLDIKNSASTLGLRDLDEACFDFLLPKLISSSAPFPRKTCCKPKEEKRLSKPDCGVHSDNELWDENEVKPVADSPSQQEAAWPSGESLSSKMGSQSTAGTLAPAAEGANAHFMQCLKYRKFQLACGRRTCITEKTLSNSVPRNDCDLAGSPCYSSSGGKNVTELLGKSSSADLAAPANGKSGMCNVKTEVQKNKEEGELEEREREMLRVKEDMRCNVRAGSPCQRAPGLILHHCPLRDFAEAPADSGSGGRESLVMDVGEDERTRGAAEEVKVEEEDGELAVEREVAEHLAKRFWSPQPELRDGNTAGGPSDPGGRAAPDWPRFRSANPPCPFLPQDLDQSRCSWKGGALSECEGASQSGVSSLNSGEDGDSETEADSESYKRERARQVQLPVSVDWIVDLSRNDFQQLLKDQVFTREQLDFVHDMRRRSKNRLAAQRCRKRKLDCIHNLQCEINKLKTEREKLMMEKSQLHQLKAKACHSVSALCQRVCSEANLQPDQLQVLAKYTSPDCPLASFFPHRDSHFSQSCSFPAPTEEPSSCSGSASLAADCPGNGKAP